MGPRPISLVLQKFTWRSQQYAIANTGPVQLRLLPGLQLAAGDFKVNDGDLTLKSKPQGARLAGQVNLKKFPPSLFTPADHP